MAKDLYFSIVIPYYAQPETLHFLMRQLNYYNNHEIDCPVIIAVSGQDSSIKKLQQFISVTGNSNFQLLIHHDEDIKNISSYISKLYEAIKRVETPYVTLNGADDVLMLDAVVECCKTLEKESNVSAVKGHTVRYDINKGKIFYSKDIPILGRNPLDRIKQAIKDRDSIYYLVQKTSTLFEEFEILKTLYENSKDLFENNLFLPEHLRAVNIAALGNVQVLNMPWRIQTSHNHNHSYHTPASFIRIQKGLMKKNNYRLFQKLNNRINDLSYIKYKLFALLCQIRNTNVTFKQILYEFYKKRISLKEFLKINMYFFLNKIYVFIFYFFRKQVEYHSFNKEFMKAKTYEELKNHYFSQNEILLIESFKDHE